jgi:hypothetical protein
MTETDSIDELRLSRSFNRLWIVSFSVAIIFAIPVVVLKDKAPWIISIPIIVGVFIGIALEARDEFGEEVRNIDDDVETLSSEFKGLLDYTGRIVLEVPATKQDKDQELFSFLQPDKTSRKKITRVRLDSGEEIFVVSCDRYIDLLVTRLLEESDMIVEHSLIIASKRFGSARPDQLRQKGFLTKTILETLKSDFRGNWITVVSRNAERVLKELENKAKSELNLTRAPKEGV